MALDHHIICTSGFRQEFGHQETGIDDLYVVIHSRYCSQTTIVHRQYWNSDFQALAAFINRNRGTQPPLIQYIGYSWGVGNGAIKFARALRQYDLNIASLFSIDGVFRSDWLWQRWRSLVPRGMLTTPQIKLPPNIGQVTYWRQENSVPQGHRFYKAGDEQIILAGNARDGLIPDANHTTIDNDPSIHNSILNQLFHTPSHSQANTWES